MSHTQTSNDIHNSNGKHHKLKVPLFLCAPYTATQHHRFHRTNVMSTVTITQAQDKGLRQQTADIFGKIRGFAIGLYAAHGGWVAQSAQDGREQLMALAAAAESHSPALSAELRNFASQ
jgi:hypothetical protein